MLGRNIALALTLCLLSSMTFAAAPVGDPTGMWSGKIKDLSLRKLAPKPGFMADAETWKKLWTAWRPYEDLPKVDFAKELILVGTVPGPNHVVIRPTFDEAGNVKLIVFGTEIGGQGFGYKFIKIGRESVKTVNGKALIDNETCRRGLHYSHYPRHDAQRHCCHRRRLVSTTEVDHAVGFAIFHRHTAVTISLSPVTVAADIGSHVSPHSA